MGGVTTRLVSRDPATHERLGSVRVASRAEVARAVARAGKAATAWARTPCEVRASILNRAADLLAARVEDFARRITREEGKPLAEARQEAENTAARIRWFATRGVAALAPRREPVSDDLVGIVEHRPVGVVAAVKPWNFPLNIPVWTIAPALLAGNGVVFKPSERTPLVGRELVRLFYEAGVPKGVLQVVFGSDPVGKALVASDVDLVAFVGSAAAGSHIAARAAPQAKRLILEMGGKDPAVVLEDADVEKTAEGLVRGAFKNCGQVCCSVERVYVARRIAKAMTEAVVERTRRLVIGHGLDESVDVGPMIHPSERRRVERFVADARRRGARVLAGGKRPKVDLPGCFYEPTVLDRVPENALVLREETFGPVLPIVPVRDEEEAVKRANALPYGLTATVWTGDPERGAEVARRIEAGTVAVNRNTGSIVEHPWGGVKRSGFGRLLGFEGVRAFAEVVTIRLPA